MELAVPKMDQRSQISFVLGSNIVKIIKNDRVHRFLAYEGENIPSNIHVHIDSCFSNQYEKIFIINLWELKRKRLVRKKRCRWADRWAVILKSVNAKSGF